jgi:hypothetical protein
MPQMLNRRILLCTFSSRYGVISCRTICGTDDLPCPKLDQDKVNTLAKRVEEAVADRADMAKKLEKTDKASHEFFNYFQLEIERKVEAFVNFVDFFLLVLV